MIDDIHRAIIALVALWGARKPTLVRPPGYLCHEPSPCRTENRAKATSHRPSQPCRLQTPLPMSERLSVIGFDFPVAFGTPGTLQREQHLCLHRRTVLDYGRPRKIGAARDIQQPCGMMSRELPASGERQRRILAELPGEKGLKPGDDAICSAGHLVWLDDARQQPDLTTWREIEPLPEWTAEPEYLAARRQLGRA
jgi:hypothetical protein